MTGTEIDVLTSSSSLGTFCGVTVTGVSPRSISMLVEPFSCFSEESNGTFSIDACKFAFMLCWVIRRIYCKAAACWMSSGVTYWLGSCGPVEPFYWLNAFAMICALRRFWSAMVFGSLEVSPVLRSSAWAPLISRAMSAGGVLSELPSASIRTVVALLGLVCFVVRTACVRSLSDASETLF